MGYAVLHSDLELGMFSLEELTTFSIIIRKCLRKRKLLLGSS